MGQDFFAIVLHEFLPVLCITIVSVRLVTHHHIDVVRTP